MNEQKIKSEITNMRNKTFKEIEAILRKFDFNDQNMIASFVASLCGVDVADMLSVTHHANISQARWMYWYAQRYYTHDTYQRISERTMLDGHSFSLECICRDITKIMAIIESDDVWRRRWVVTKRMLKLLNDPMDYQPNDFSYNSQKYKVMLQVPRGTKENVEVEVVESK